MIKLFIFNIVLVVSILTSKYCLAENKYLVYVTRRDSNLYEDISQGISIKTRYCIEFAAYQKAILVGYGLKYGGELIFLDYDNNEKNKCDVEGVYTRISY